MEKARFQRSHSMKNTTYYVSAIMRFPHPAVEDRWEYISLHATEEVAIRAAILYEADGDRSVSPARVICEEAEGDHWEERVVWPLPEGETYAEHR